ncbi:MAG TPA: hypothetical protein VJP41_12555, partial [Gaiellaceae bacterium]|nr:hypothetical protein [Gaiellaceae bacterium]
MSAEQERIPQRQLGELMTELGLISEEQLATVLEVQQQSKRPLGQIIVELGFASGAAVAHALAMQSGGALRTEFGFALGVHSGQAEAAADVAETRAGLPKLRLAATAVAPTIRQDSPAEEAPEAAAEPEAEASAEPEENDVDPAVEAREEIETTDGVEPAKEVADAAEVEDAATVEPGDVVPEVEESTDTEPEETLDEALVEALDEILDGTDVSEPAELEELRSEIERLESALA